VLVFLYRFSNLSVRQFGEGILVSFQVFRESFHEFASSLQRKLRPNFKGLVGGNHCIIKISLGGYWGLPDWLFCAWIDPIVSDFSSSFLIIDNLFLL
jgi:hypothetical protein